MSLTPFRETLPIPDAGRTDFTTLVRERFDPGRPCVLRGLFPPRALDLWIERLTASGERVTCVVLRRPDVALVSGAERPAVARAGEHPELNEFVAELTLAEVWRRMSRPGELPPLVQSGESLYVFSSPLPESLGFPPEDGAGAPIPELYRDERTPQLLVNAPGLLNRCHSHIHSYLLHQVHGRKRVRLFSPADTSRLYPDAERRSAVGDFDRVDLVRFPGVAEAVAYEGVLAPGDVLFLPSYWWHEIRVDELAVSIGFHAPCGAARDTATLLHEGIARALEQAAASAPDREILAGIAGIVLSVAASEVASDGLGTTIESLRYRFE